MATWSSLSSAVTYNIFRSPFPSCNANVDFPTPGFPPNNMRDPERSPPPKTRSTSLIPVLNRSPGFPAKTSVNDLLRD